MTNTNDMAVMQTTYAVNGQPLLFTIALDRAQALELRFYVAVGKIQRLHKMQIRFTNMTDVRIIETANGATTLSFSLLHPPKYFTLMDDVRESMELQSQNTYWDIKFAYRRETDIDKTTAPRQPVSLFRNDPHIDTGRWLTYSLDFSRLPHNQQILPLIRHALEAYNIRVSNTPLVSTRPLEGKLWHGSNRTRLQTNQSSLAALQVLHKDALPELPFELQYALDVCLSRNQFHEATFTSEFLQRLLKTPSAQGLLENVATSRRRFFNPMEIFTASELRVRRKLKAPKDCILMHSVTVTPTTIYVNSVCVEVTNRVVRRYIEHADRFLRVRFQDEEYAGKLQAQQDDSFNRVFNRVKRTLMQGIYVAGRHYQFLAFGNSQFRENGAYFFAPTPTITPLSIRAWMGLFSHIRVVAKYASRIGQCFSTTRAINSIGTRPNVKLIKDIERNGYCFSDGVGKISPFLAHMIAEEMRLGTDIPSLFQFRMGGCKGVLAVDTTLSGTTVEIRPSQKKFDTSYSHLEVVRVSSFATAYLNRQIILVLSALGIPDAVFVKKVRDMLGDINGAMHDNKAALELLQTSVDYNQVTISLAKMITAGFRNDPFVASLLELWRASSIKQLKEKATVVVKDGAFLLGCMDETGSLLMNDSQLPQIFLQIPDKEANEKGVYKIITGRCILVRNPALHPGDVRVVEAVDCEKLRHLKNVVVFPQRGSRPLANMCAGGDLDGDDYLVMWDKDLIPSETADPMDYTPPTPVISHGPVTSSDTIAFFCEYMKNDSLGNIAVAHRAWADYLPQGVKDSRCKKLAQLHSEAVDYPKTGVPAQLTPDLRVQKYPHWCGKPANKSYHSDKVAGQMYDEVERVDFKPEYRESFDNRVLTAFESIPTEVLNVAKQLKTEYDEDIRRVMAQYGIQTEFEIWSAFVMQHNRVGSDYKFAEELGRTMNTLKAHFRESLLEQAGSLSGLANQQASFYLLIAAAYRVTAHEMVSTHQHMLHILPMLADPDGYDEFNRMPLISFPWVFADELSHIAKAKDATSNGQWVDPATLSRPLGWNGGKAKLSRQQLSKMDSDDLICQPLAEVELPSASTTKATAATTKARVATQVVQPKPVSTSQSATSDLIAAMLQTSLTDNHSQPSAIGTPTSMAPVSIPSTPPPIESGSSDPPSPSSSLSSSAFWAHRDEDQENSNSTKDNGKDTTAAVATASVGSPDTIRAPTKSGQSVCGIANNTTRDDSDEDESEFEETIEDPMDDLSSLDKLAAMIGQ